MTIGSYMCVSFADIKELESSVSTGLLLAVLQSTFMDLLCYQNYCQHYTYTQVYSRSIFTNFGLSLVDSFSKDVTNGAISNGCAHHENSAKKKDACNGELHNGTVSNGDIKKSDTHLRQRNRDTSSESSTPNETVQETGRKNMCYECRCRAGLFLDKTQDRW